MRTCTELLVERDEENGCNVAALMGKLKVCEEQGELFLHC